MQAAVSRSSRPDRARRGHKPTATPRLVAVDDTGLLDALPIAAAIIEQDDPGAFKVTAHNSRFFQTVQQSSCTALDWNDADCLKSGPIAEVLQKFFEGTDVGGEIDFKDGEGVSAHHFRLKLAPLPKAKDGGSRCLLSVVDRTVEVQAERTLRAEMLRDSLTGLPNRLAFTEAVEKAGEKVNRDLEHAVLVVDMLRFSRINESMGSLAGDELLITFARRLILALRAGDVLARTGGNEFGVLVSLRRGVEDALKAAERIQDVMTTPFKLSDLEIRVECAIGVALMHARQDPEELFRNAQFAVKQAKAAGKPQVYEAKQATEARRRFSIETELRRALDKEQLKLFYQPLINLKSGEVSGFEALARWNHEDRGEISPTEFIPVAEESGLILQLGRWAISTLTSIAVISLVYHWGIPRTQPFYRVLPGATLATVAWFTATVGFGWYVTKYANYTAIYGSLGAAIALLVWTYIVSIVVLIGAEFNALVYPRVVLEEPKAILNRRGNPVGVG